MQRQKSIIVQGRWLNDLHMDYFNYLLGCVLMEKEIAERNSNGKKAGWELTNQNDSVPLFHTRAPHDELSQPQRNSLDRGSICNMHI